MGARYFATTPGCPARPCGRGRTVCRSRTALRGAKSEPATASIGAPAWPTKPAGLVAERPAPACRARLRPRGRRGHPGRLPGALAAKQSSPCFLGARRDFHPGQRIAHQQGGTGPNPPRHDHQARQLLHHGSGALVWGMPAAVRLALADRRTGSGPAGGGADRDGASSTAPIDLYGLAHGATYFVVLRHDEYGILKAYALLEPHPTLPGLPPPAWTSPPWARATGPEAASRLGGPHRDGLPPALPSRASASSISHRKTIHTLLCDG